MSARRRSGFTLVEMLVSVALVLFIMVILTEAFGKGLESFRTLKAVGDMESRLRTAASLLRRDLQADHFEGKRRLSDPAARWNATGIPREGFLAVLPGAAAPEGADSDGIGSARQLDHLYCTVKLRGNQRNEFFMANLAPPAGGQPSPLLNPLVRTTFFDQPADARFQENTQATYSGQWAEVLYVPMANGTTAGNQPLSTLYRGQLVVVADNSKLNWASIAGPGCPVPETPQTVEQHKEISCYTKVDQGNRYLYFNNPTDLQSPAGRTFYPAGNRSVDRWPLTPVLTDVLSFAVDYYRLESNGTLTLVSGTAVDSANRGNPVVAVQITLRVWDSKTRQTRQMTIFQEL